MEKECGEDLLQYRGGKWLDTSGLSVINEVWLRQNPKCVPNCIPPVVTPSLISRLIYSTAYKTGIFHFFQRKLKFHIFETKQLILLSTPWNSLAPRAPGVEGTTSPLGEQAKSQEWKLILFFPFSPYRWPSITWGSHCSPTTFSFSSPIHVLPNSVYNHRLHRILETPSNCSSYSQSHLPSSNVLQHGNFFLKVK